METYLLPVVPANPRQLQTSDKSIFSILARSIENVTVAEDDITEFCIEVVNEEFEYVISGVQITLSPESTIFNIGGMDPFLLQCANVFLLCFC